jgi:hypothetical protein
MADEFDLEQEVARLRGKLKALTVITVLFMLASGGLAAAVYMKVSKKPAEKPIEEVRLESKVLQGGALVTVGQVEAWSDKFGTVRMANGALELQAPGLKETVRLDVQRGLSITWNGGTQIRLGQVDGEPALTFGDGDKQVQLTAATLAKLLEPPAPPPAPTPTPTPAPAQPAAPATPP